MNLQTIFDTALNGIRAQGGPSIRTIDGESNCAYRGRLSRKCGVGFLITDEAYKAHRDCEGLTCDEPPARAALKASGITHPRHLELAKAIQGAHDGAQEGNRITAGTDRRFMERFERRMTIVAGDFNLRP